MRSREEVEAAKNGGVDCLEELIQVQDCNLDACPKGKFSNDLGKQYGELCLRDIRASTY